jgi:hypothetical protein
LGLGPILGQLHHLLKDLVQRDRDTLQGPGLQLGQLTQVRSQMADSARLGKLARESSGPEGVRLAVMAASSSTSRMRGLGRPGL